MKVQNDLHMISSAYNYIIQSLQELEPNQRGAPQAFINLDLKPCKGSKLCQNLIKRRDNDTK